MRILDCTLRDGANVVGLGFDEKLTRSMIGGLLDCGITEIEFGNAHGIGCNEPGSILLDDEYLRIYQDFRGKGSFGMFLQAKKATEEVVKQARTAGLDFLRVGCLAGKAETAYAAVKLVKKHGLSCRYSMMRVYLLTPDEAAGEAALLEENGVDDITLMDSAGTMLPEEVEEYVRKVKEAVNIPVGFHGHNNLGLAIANAMAAEKAGADSIDTGLMGMARSAGNCAAELVVAAMQRRGRCREIDLYRLLNYIDQELAPLMKEYQYQAPVSPKDLIYGLSGCHSNVAPKIEKVAQEYGIPAYPFIMEVSARDKVNPSEELMRRIAEEMKKTL